MHLSFLVCSTRDIKRIILYRQCATLLWTARRSHHKFGIIAHLIWKLCIRITKKNANKMDSLSVVASSRISYRSATLHNNERHILFCRSTSRKNKNINTCFVFVTIFSISSVNPLVCVCLCIFCLSWLYLSALQPLKWRQKMSTCNRSAREWINTKNIEKIDLSRHRVRFFFSFFVMNEPSSMELVKKK